MLPSTAGLLLVIPLPTISLSSVYLVVLVGGAQIISWTSFLSFIVLAVGTPLITWTTTISSQSLITWVTSYSRSISFYHVVVHYPAVVPSLSYRTPVAPTTLLLPPHSATAHHPAVAPTILLLSSTLPGGSPLTGGSRCWDCCPPFIHYPPSTILLLLPTYTPSTSLLPPIDNPSFIIASVLVPGRFALIFWMSWIIWRNKVSLPSTFYELPV